MSQMVESLCSIDPVYFFNFCFDLWLGISDSLDRLVVASHLSDRCSAVAKAFKPTASNAIGFSSRNFASSNIDCFLNPGSHDDTILCGKRRFLIENLD